jgi:hypothetical protein
MSKLKDKQLRFFSYFANNEGLLTSSENKYIDQEISGQQINSLVGKKNNSYRSLTAVSIL